MTVPKYTWESEPFKLDLLDIASYGEHSRVYVEYKFYHDDILVFSGDDFSPSPTLSAPFDEMSAMQLLGFLSLVEGDTDDEYFDYYTEAQIAWRDKWAEELSLVVHDWEEMQ